MKSVRLIAAGLTLLLGLFTTSAIAENQDSTPSNCAITWDALERKQPAAPDLIDILASNADDCLKTKVFLHLKAHYADSLPGSLDTPYENPEQYTVRWSDVMARAKEPYASRARDELLQLEPRNPYAWEDYFQALATAPDPLKPALWHRMAESYASPIALRDVIELAPEPYKHYAYDLLFERFNLAEDHLGLFMRGRYHVPQEYLDRTAQEMMDRGMDQNLVEDRIQLIACETSDDIALKLLSRFYDRNSGKVNMLNVMPPESCSVTVRTFVAHKLLNSNPDDYTLARLSSLAPEPYRSTATKWLELRGLSKEELLRRITESE